MTSTSDVRGRQCISAFHADGRDDGCGSLRPDTMCASSPCWASSSWVRSCGKSKLWARIQCSSNSSLLFPPIVTPRDCKNCLRKGTFCLQRNAIGSSPVAFTIAGERWAKWASKPPALTYFFAPGWRLRHARGDMGYVAKRVFWVVTPGLDLDPNPESCTLPLDQLAAWLFVFPCIILYRKSVLLPFHVDSTKARDEIMRFIWPIPCQLMPCRLN